MAWQKPIEGKFVWHWMDPQRPVSRCGKQIRVIGSMLIPDRPQNFCGICQRSLEKTLKRLEQTEE